MHAAFLVTAAKSGGPDDGLGIDWHPDADTLGFAPGGAIVQEFGSGTILRGWQNTDAAGGPTMWHVGDGQAVIVAGQVRWRNRSWSGAGHWAGELAAARRASEPHEIADELGGVFALCWLDADGRALVVADPLALRSIYYGENDHVTAIGTRAELVASALAGRDTLLERDRQSVAWLAYNTYRVGDATGYRDVRVLPPGASATVQHGRAIAIDGGTKPWLPTDAENALNRDELIDAVRHDIADTLRASLTFPADRRVVRLTGGKDSRLILAVALWAGIANEFEYETFGPPHLADVRVASDLADRFDLRHTVHFLDAAPARPWNESVGHQIRQTGGMLNAWDLEGGGIPPPEDLQILGLCGELLRTFRPLAREPETIDDLVALFPATAYNRSGIVKPEAADLLHRAMLERLLDDAEGHSQPLDLFDAYYFTNRLRYTRMGVQEELARPMRVLPLYSIGSLRCAFALGGPARQSELLHYEVMRRCAEVLPRIPFADSAWRPELGVDELEPAPPPPLPTLPEGTMIEGHPATPELIAALVAHFSAPSDASAQPVAHLVHDEAFDERRPIFAGAFSDASNPVWDQLDQSAALAALDRFPDLGLVERRELYGALAAALWLAGDSS
jgi:hypothetical protein